MNKWIERWQAKLAAPDEQQQQLAADSGSDWAQLRSRGYGKDEILRWCDVGNKVRLAQHLLCALLYENKIRVVTGTEDDQTGGPLPSLERH
jgi:hypothetical protein